MDKLFCCTACGVEGKAKCGCGKGYKFMPASEMMAIRKQKAQELYGEGQTMEQIAKVLGVSAMTISTDLKTFKDILKVPPRVDRHGRKNTGRPKGSRLEAPAPRPRKQDTKTNKVRLAVRERIDKGEPISRKDIAKEFGVGEHAVQLAHAEELGRREAQTDPEITPDMLSKSAQEKLARAMRQHQKNLDATFEKRVMEDIKRRVEKLVLPCFEEERKDHELQMQTRKGAFTQVEYNIILRCVHPDQSPSGEQKTEAFRLLHERRSVLLSDKDDPKKYPKLPTIDEFMSG